MCGIVGKVENNLCVKDQVFQPLELLQHRGPDEQDIFCTENMVFGHARLAIIDTAHGHQPIQYTLNGKIYTMVYNGEVYNYKRLRTILKSENIDILTDSDTEVVVKWLVQKGVYEGVKELNGMFAIALYCHEDETLFLCRDRMGIKPLYYYQNGGLFFSSEIESLVSFDEVPKVLNQEALEQFLYFGYPVLPNTMYENVYEQRPGTILEYCVKSNKVKEVRYWNIDHYSRTYAGTYEDAVEDLDKLLQSVIKDQMMSDVGYGTFLSGGIDSSLVTSMVSIATDKQFNAYTVSFNDKKYDELPYAQKVVAQYPNIMHKIYYSSSFNIDSGFVDLILSHVGQPFADSSCIPTYLISKEVSQNETVILSGDGGDELFMGYESFSWLDKIDKVKLIPGLLREIVLYIVKKLPLDTIIDKNLHRQINKALTYSLGDETELAFSLNSLLDIDQLQQITDKESLGWLKSLKKELMLQKLDPYTVLQRFLIKVKLSGDMLRKVDSMTMANSIEVRVPLLDNRVVDFALSLPVEYLYREGQKKSILKDVAKKYLPDEVIEHKKWGFSIPMHKVLSNEFIDTYQSLFDKYTILNSDVIRDFQKIKIENKESIYTTYSQYTIDHINWMAILLYRWVELSGVKVVK